MAMTRRGISALVISSVVVVALVAAYFVADSMLRNYAEGRIKQEILGNLPDGVTGDATVSIDGISVIQQYLFGSFDRIEVTAPALMVSGTAASVHLVATHVPVDREKPVGAVHGTVDLGPKSLSALLSAAGVPGDPELQLGTNDVTYTGTFRVFGFPIDYLATATPTVSGDSVVLAPTAAKIKTDVGALDVSGIVQRILADKPIELCVAQYLPAAVHLTDVNVTPERVRFALAAKNLILDEESLGALGSCAGT